MSAVPDPRQLEFRAVQRSAASLRAQLPELSEPLRKLLARLEGAPLPCVGVVHLACPRCETRERLAFRCGANCPLCGGRGAPRRLESLIPEVPIRHWSISLPSAMRRRLLLDHALVRKIGRAFVRSIFASLRRRARRAHGPGPVRCGAVNVTQRFGGGLEANVHFHALVVEGVWAEGGESSAAPKFLALEPPPPSERRWVLERTRARVEAVFRESPPPREVEDALREIHARAEAESAPASEAESATAPVKREAGTPNQATRLKPGVLHCAGFSLEADERVEAEDRGGVRRLCRYVTRAPLRSGALSPVEGHDAAELRLSRAWSDGTRRLRFEGGALAERLLALMPEDRPSHAVAYHGVLAPNAALRWRVQPPARQIPLALPALDPSRPRPPERRAEPKPPAAAASPPEPGGVPRCRRCEGQMMIVAVEDACDLPALMDEGARPR